MTARSANPNPTTKFWSNVSKQFLFRQIQKFVGVGKAHGLKKEETT
jgi:hypothetical protein